MPTSGVIPAAGHSIFAKRSVRGRVSNLSVGIECAQALSLIVNPMPPRITEQSYRPRVSDRTMVATCTSRLIPLTSNITDDCALTGTKNGDQRIEVGRVGGTQAD